MVTRARVARQVYSAANDVFCVVRLSVERGTVTGWTVPRVDVRIVYLPDLQTGAGLLGGRGRALSLRYQCTRPQLLLGTSLRYQCIRPQLLLGTFMWVSALNGRRAPGGRLPPL